MNNKQLDRLVEAHIAEAERNCAEFYNLGWGIGDRDICSKTDQGLLQTIRVGKHYRHIWE